MEGETEKIDAAHQKVEEYNPKWVEWFVQEAEKIKQLLGDRITRIEHIGSTSVPGLAAKPIIDVAVEVQSSEDTKSVIESLASYGYILGRDGHDNDISTERHFLRKGMPTRFHLSICYGNKGSFLERQTIFRDYLREHNAERDAYGELKKELLQKDPTGRSGYICGKTDFVMSVLKKAGFENKWFDLSKY